MPRDNDKNNDSRGRRDRQGGGKGRDGGGGKGRSGAARGPEKKFAKRGFAGKGEGDGERRPYAGKSDGAKSFGKKPYAGGGKPSPASAMAMTVRRAATMATCRGLVLIATTARRATVRIVARERISARVRMARSGRSSRVATDRTLAAMIVAAKSGRTRHVVTVPISTATTGHRAAIEMAAMPVRPGVSRTENSATRNPTRRVTATARSGLIPRVKVAARNALTLRAAKVSAKTVTGLAAIVRSAHGPRAMVIAPSANSAATRSSRHAVHQTVVRARTLVIVRAVAIQAVAEARGSRRARASAIASLVAIVRLPIVHSGNGRSSIGPAKIAATARSSTGRASDPRAAPIGRSIRAVNPARTVRAATTRTTAGFLQNVRRLAAAAPIASARPISTSVHRVPNRKRKPANALPR